MAHKDPEKAKAYWKAYNAKRRPVKEKSARKVAIENGEAHYHTGKPCIHGHIAKRNTISRICTVCDIAKQNRLRKENPEKYKRKNEKIYANNREKILIQKKKYRQDNKASINALSKAYKTRKMHRIPKWIGAEEMWLIKEAYRLAKLRTSLHGFTWHVDHIIPLQGELVSGLHVPENLQVIPWLDNVKKKNKYEVA